MSSRYTLPLVDGMRALGALAVFVTHVTVLAGAPEYAFYAEGTSHIGEVGLAVLFAISGFLLSRPWTAERHGGRPGPTVGAYARNRVLRLLPAYWVALTIQLLVPGGFPGFTDPGLPQYAVIQIYSESWTFDGLKHAWTLGTETAFYVVLVVYSFVIARRFAGDKRWELWALLALAAIGPLTHFVIFSLRDHWLIALQWLLGYMDYVVVGMILALFAVRRRRGDALPRAVDWLVANPLCRGGSRSRSGCSRSSC